MIKPFKPKKNIHRNGSVCFTLFKNEWFNKFFLNKIKPLNSFEIYNKIISEPTHIYFDFNLFFVFRFTISKQEKA